MQNFIYDIPAKVYFGKGEIKRLPNIVKEYGKKVLLVYGGGSIKKSGLYDDIISLLGQCDAEISELHGVDPNPRISTVRKGVEICKAENIDVILGVGGGSVIDCSKAIAAGSKYSGDAWDLCIGVAKVREALPIIAVTTMAATGSEMDPFSVITNEQTNDKKSLAGTHLVPKAAICDPTYTFSVSKFQTASGTADIISHTLETYFRKIPGAYIQERMCEAVLKTCFHYGKIAVENPEDYDARANLMWASELAINGLLKYGFAGPWVVHPIEHQLSGYYDIPHGAGLAILTPHWFRKILENPDSLDIFYTYGTNVWSIDPSLSKEEIANIAIAKTEEFFASIGLPKTLRELGITQKDKFDIMAEKAIEDGAGKTYFPLSKKDIVALYEASF